MNDVNEEEKKAYEKRLRRRLEILKQKLEAGDVKFAPGLKIKESLRSVKYGVDGEINLETVDAKVRSLALAVTHMHDRNELKSAVSFSEIQKTYFQFIEDNFGEFFKIMKDKGMNPHEAGLVASKNSATISEITTPISEFMEAIESFWHNCAEASYVHVQESKECQVAIELSLA
jgi:hypothetical protein